MLIGIGAQRSIMRSKAAATSTMVAFLAIASAARAFALCGTPGNASCPGTLLTTYYDTTGDNGSGTGDNILKLINPVGCADGNLCANQTANLCAMLYVFDSNENLGECCGCALSPQKLLSLSVENSLTASWGLSGSAPGAGAIEIVSTVPNVPICTSKGCTSRCDPATGYSPTRELNGYIVHNQKLPAPIGTSTTPAILEVQLSDAGDAHPPLQTNLITRCSALLNQDSGGACNCGSAAVGNSSH